jgi:hypothetical protein
MVCRGLLLELERNGYIVLPPRKFTPINPFLKPKAPEKIELDQSPIKTTLKELLPLTFVQVRRTPREKLFNSLICHHHYLGYTQPVGEHLKYLVYSNSLQRPVACFAWSSAVRHLESRDRFIGWNKETRTKNLHLLAYNTRFLIHEAWTGSEYLIWRLIFWANVPKLFHPIGKSFTITRCIGWKPLWILNVLKVPVINRPIGYILARQRD